MIRTYQQNKELHMLLQRLGINDDARHEIVYQVTMGRVERSSEMTKDECATMILHLRKLADESTTVRALSDASNKMRRKVFHLAHELGWEKENGKVDQEKLDGWMLKYSYLRKPLQQYNYQELPELISQLEIILKKTYGKEGVI